MPHVGPRRTRGGMLLIAGGLAGLLALAPRAYGQDAPTPESDAAAPSAPPVQPPVQPP